VPLAQYSIDAAWSRTRTGVITVGTSTVGGSDVIGGLFSQYTFASVKNDVKEITIQRGASGEGGSLAAGSCTIRLKDTAGTYNPANASSSLAPNVVPMRPVRVRATHNATTYGLFFGWITRIEHDPHPSVQETVIEAEDFFHWLNVFKPVVTLGQTTVGAAILAVLNACGLSDPAYLAVDTGHTIPFFVGDGTQTALSLLGEVLRADMGVLFVDGDGKVTYHDTARRYAPGAVTDTLTDALLGGVRPATDVDTVRNGWTVTRTAQPGTAEAGAGGQADGVPQNAEDATSRDPSQYGPRDDALSSPYLESDSRAGNLAGIKVLLHKDPDDPAREVVLSNKNDTSITKQLARDLGDTVALSEALGGTSLTGWVDGVRHRVWEAGKFHEAALRITRRRLTFATVGTATVGGSDRIGY
jgi:hypothetical protein